MQEDCLFCRFAEEGERTFLENGRFYARWDGYPVSDGHVIIIPKRHIESFFDLKVEDIIPLHAIIRAAKIVVDECYAPDGYNIGVNEGVVAGRSVHHLHIHVIPRYKGDVENPRGGVRGVIPEKQDYDG